MTTKILTSACHCINLREAARKLTHLYDQALTDSGLKVTQYSLLSKIKMLKSPSLANLASATGLDRSTLGRNVRLLEKSGLVSMSTAENDGRMSVLTLTKKGMRAIEIALNDWKKCQDRIQIAMGDDFHNQLTEMIEKLDALESKLHNKSGTK